MPKKKQNLKSFTDLNAWKKSRNLRKQISKLTEELPRDEKYRLKDQLLRSSRSVTANIAEGYGRFHYQENIQYCRQARGSLYEVIDHLICVYDENYIKQNTLKKYKNDVTECIRLLNGFISYLRKTKQHKVSEPKINYADNSPH